MVLNAHHDLVEFVLPEITGGREWSLLVDTNLAEDAELAILRRVRVTARPGDRFFCLAFARRTRLRRLPRRKAWSRADQLDLRRHSHQGRAAGGSSSS
jgi:hypothetical protein